ncbi:tyrosine 3-monooxygenase isoform X1 [Daktulosphaira vitifoliae]|uniref:tyrosine 3-monooxygenase isoform X1 n=1 Tax=Daktulosphaira vitifoliae TaxID=58002 RepID=UPI0021AA82AA|nr:tyrosine 3-monooxygenase isoform X1 [Daktulosphaira vitifoliae]
MALAAAQKSREMFAIKKSYSIENGYPARRRSLVDDARFETLVVKQTKQAVLEEARELADVNPLEYEDQGFESEEKLNEQESFTEELSELSSDNYDSDAGLTEEEVLLEKATGHDKDAENAVQKSTLVLRLREDIDSCFARLLNIIHSGKGKVIHIESRPSKERGVKFDILVKVDITRKNLLALLKSLRQSSTLASVTVLAEDNTNVKDPWFPKHARDLDNCNHLMTKYEPELDMNHPGFADQVYRARRKDIANVAFEYKYGDLIPKIEYTKDELSTWSAVFNTVLDLMPKHFCMEYRNAFKMLQDENIFTADKIPQLYEMSDFLKKHTGFTLRPAAGLLTARDFLASLAFRVFQSTQYIRHSTTPFHTPEPDYIHEVLGHMPLLADPSFAQFSQELGLASLGASDEEIEKLSTVYWFTIEFGLCKEHGEVKAYGAGLLSAYGELLHAVSGKPELRPFEPSTTAVQPYQDQEYQPIYFVAESFEDAKDKFRKWVSTMSRPFEVRYNPHTQRAEILDSVDQLNNLMSQLNLEMLHLNNAMNKLKMRSG